MGTEIKERKSMVDLDSKAVILAISSLLTSFSLLYGEIHQYEEGLINLSYFVGYFLP
jgi:hypothetical protein